MKHIFTLLFLIKYILCPAQVISTIAGSGAPGNNGDSIQASLAELYQPYAITTDLVGNVYIVDNGNDNIRKVGVDGIISIIAGEQHKDGSARNRDATPCYIPDYVLATATLVWKPQSICIDPDGNILFTEGCSDLRKIDSKGIITTVINSQGRNSRSSDFISRTMIRSPKGLVTDKENNIYFSDPKLNKIQKFDVFGHITTIAGNGIEGNNGNNGPATNASLNSPAGLILDANGNIIFTDKNNHCIRKVSAAGIITTIAGKGEKGYDGDNYVATKATLNEPTGIAIDRIGNLYVADSKNDVIRKIDTLGIITTFAGKRKNLYHGDGIMSSSSYVQEKGKAGDGGPATAAQLYWPADVAVDTAGNVYIADMMNHAVRKVTVPVFVEKETLPESEKYSISIDIERNMLKVITEVNTYTLLGVSIPGKELLIRQAITNAITEVNVKSLLPGMYYLHLFKGGHEKIVRFVKE